MAKCKLLIVASDGLGVIRTDKTQKMLFAEAGYPVTDDIKKYKDNCVARVFKKEELELFGEIEDITKEEAETIFNIENWDEEI